MKINKALGSRKHFSLQLINDRPSHEIRKLLAKTKKESGTSITSNLHNRKNSEKPTTADVEAAKAGAAENLEGKDRPDFELFDINSEVMVGCCELTRFDLIIQNEIGSIFYL